MSLNLTLQLYQARLFLRFFFFALLALSCSVALLDSMELIRRTSAYSYITNYDTLLLIFYKLWGTIYKVFPFAVWLAAACFFVRKIITNENIALKAAGASPLQILLAPCTCMLIIGLINSTVFNNVASQFSDKYDNLEQTLLNQNSDHLFLAKGDIWLRQESDGNRKAIIHAETASDEGKTFYNVEAFLISGDNAFLQRISAASASLRNGFWWFQPAIVTDSNGAVNKREYFLLATTLTPNKIKSGISKPEHLSLWKLPQFIKELEKSNFNTTTYRLRLQQIIAEPIFLLAILLMTAGLLLHVNSKQNKAKVYQMCLYAILATLGFYFLNNLIHAWSLNGYLPVAIAAWVVPLASLLVATGLLLHLEEG